MDFTNVCPEGTQWYIIFGKSFIENSKSFDSFFNFREIFSKNGFVNMCCVPLEYTLIRPFIDLA